MIPTQDTPWPSIPYSKLMAAVEKQTDGRFVRSDSISVHGAPAGPAAPHLPEGFQEGQLWYDYSMAVETA
jgi:hypothetical protein